MALEDTEHSERDCELPAEHLHSIIPKFVEDAAGSPLTHAQLAQMLWSTNYVDHMLHELTLYPDISVRLCSLRVSAPCTLCPPTPTSWCAQETVIELVCRLRGRRKGELAEDRAALLRVGTLCSTLARERSQKVLPFSVVARSLSWLMQRVPNRVWVVSVTVWGSLIRRQPCAFNP